MNEINFFIYNLKMKEENNFSTLVWQYDDFLSWISTKGYILRENQHNYRHLETMGLVKHCETAASQSQFTEESVLLLVWNQAKLLGLLIGRGKLSFSLSLSHSPNSLGTIFFKECLKPNQSTATTLKLSSYNLLFLVLLTEIHDIALFFTKPQLIATLKRTYPTLFFHTRLEIQFFFYMSNCQFSRHRY